MTEVKLGGNLNLAPFNPQGPILREAIIGGEDLGVASVPSFIDSTALPPELREKLGQIPSSVVQAEPLAVSLNSPSLRIPTEQEVLAARTNIQYRPYNPATFITDDGLTQATYNQKPYSFTSGIGQFFVLKRAEVETEEEDVQEEGEGAPDTNLAKGSEGEDVKKLQQRLKEEGFDPGEIDGKFGDKTEAALKAWQKAKGLDVDGIAGPQTFAKLFTSPSNQAPNTSAATSGAAVAPPQLATLRNGSEGADVRKLQERLKTLGYDPGTLDGEFGPQTEAALRAAQQALGVTVDGIAGPETYSKLFASSPNQSTTTTGQRAPIAKSEETRSLLEQAGVKDFSFLGESGLSGVNTVVSNQGSVRVLTVTRPEDNRKWEFILNPPSVANSQPNTPSPLTQTAVSMRQQLANFGSGIFNAAQGFELPGGNQLSTAIRPQTTATLSPTQRVTPSNASFTLPETIGSRDAEAVANAIARNVNGTTLLDNTATATYTNSAGETVTAVSNKVSIPVDRSVPEANLTPETEADTTQIPNEWKFTVAPASIGWGKQGNFQRDNPYGTNKQMIYYSSTGMRTLSLGECLLEGFSIGKSVESKIRLLEKCMEVERQQAGFIAPYVWELFGIGKSYGYYIISNVSVQEILRDDRGSATRAVVSLELQEVPKYQIYNGRDLARPNDLAKPNFCISGGSDGTTASSGSPGSSGVSAENEAQLREQGFKGSLQFIKDKEGFESKAYFDVNGYSIGYGTKDSYIGADGQVKSVVEGSTITEPEAESALVRTFSTRYLPNLKQIPFWDEMSSCKQSALASFSWNLGADFYQRQGDDFATIQRALSSKENWSQVPDALLLYNKAGGVTVSGLTTRRQEEGKLWNQC